MWNRKELKARGKAAFKANYWRCVLVAFILTLLAGAIGGAAGGTTSSSYTNQQQQIQEQLQSGGPIVIGEQTFESVEDFLENGPTNTVGAVLGIIAGVIAAVGIIGLLLNIFIFNPLAVGCQRFFAENSSSPARLGEMGYGFKNGYGRVVGAMLLQDIFLFLWTLLFIIPGIIKLYAYRMVPYILAEEPELSGTAVITRSRQMMKGHKWKAFVLDLSFILWYLLSAVTCGIVGIFYVYPYVYATNAELYHELRRLESAA
ncbi:MAG: DUF975 family protein [Oscillospiraceae bacterium]|nr:DUF975 family protein [Oscillospiraceae bacterium]